MIASAASFRVAVLSGNRNFPGRVHPQLEAGVPGLAAAGRRLRARRRRQPRHPDRADRPDADGRAVRLADLWPSGDEIDAALAAALDPGDYDDGLRGAPRRARPGADARRAGDADLSRGTRLDLYPPPAFRGPRHGARCLGRYAAHPLLVLGDDITTDHISPAGQIPVEGEAADYLVERGENRRDLNVFASRRGNWEVMLRGLFTNRSARNLLDPQAPPGCDRPRAERRRAAAVARRRALPRGGRAASSWWRANATAWARRATGPRKAPALLGVRAVLAVELRAHPSLEPDRHGHPAVTAAGRVASDRSAT